jgi:hypothetical protein
VFTGRNVQIWDEARQKDRIIFAANRAGDRKVLQESINHAYNKSHIALDTLRDWVAWQLSHVETRTKRRVANEFSA